MAGSLSGRICTPSPITNQTGRLQIEAWTGLPDWSRCTLVATLNARTCIQPSSQSDLTWQVSVAL